MLFFFVKQKTAYEMRISDWSSDVCSSDLSPSAHGQAMISTDTALSTAYVHDGSGPNRPQTSRVATAAASTASTNQNDTLSAMRCIGARERCACAPSCTTCDRPAAPPPFLARVSSLHSPFLFAPLPSPPPPL